MTAMRRASQVLIAGLALAALAATASAAVFCAQLDGTLVVRPQQCKKHETAPDLTAFGGRGPTGATGPRGAAGVPGSARGWVLVDNASAIIAASHIATATRPSPGVYCLTPDATIDASATIGWAVPEYENSSGSSLVVYVRFPASGCPAGTFQVETYDAGGALSDNVGFVFVVT